MQDITGNEVGLVTLGGVAGTVLTKLIDFFRKKDDNKIKKEEQDHNQLINLIQLLQTVLEQEREHYLSRNKSIEEEELLLLADLKKVALESAAKDTRIAQLELEVEKLKIEIMHLKSLIKEDTNEA